MARPQYTRGSLGVEDVVAPVALATFVARYLGREPLVFPQADDRFADVLPWDDFNRQLNQLRVVGRRLRMYRDGARLDPALYLQSPEHPLGSPIAGASVERLLAGGATLVLDSADELFPAVRTLADAFEDVFRVRPSMNLYAGFRTQRGFDRHFDAHDTIILQLHGRKWWQVHAPVSPHRPGATVETAEQPVGESFWEGDLQEGGVLYLPRGWWHVARPVDEPSLHLTIGLAHPTAAQLLSWFVDEVNAAQAADPDIPHLQSPQERMRWVAAMRDRIASMWSDDVIERFMAFRDSNAVARPNIGLPINVARHMALTPDTRLRLAMGRRLVFAPAAGNERSFVTHGTTWSCPSELVPALARLNHLRGEAISELCAAAPPGLEAALKQLLGALVVSGAVSIEHEAAP